MLVIAALRWYWASAHVKAAGAELGLSRAQSTRFRSIAVFCELI
jgi:hypothetical protein